MNSDIYCQIYPNQLEFRGPSLVHAHCHRQARSTGINPLTHLGDATPDSFSWLHATFITIVVCFLHILPFILCAQGLRVESFYDFWLLSYDLVLKIMSRPR